ncbi:MAG: hypothetical protein QOD81_899, partial [Solirubrobacteraceae bacterium]|nr:hypothetical protein [Solirubrobacteraceae bacterium]
MAVDRRLLRPYPAIGPSHPFAAELAHLRAQVAADPGLAGPTGAPVVIRRRLRGRPGPDGAWAIDRFCWSAQWWERGTPPRFRVRTLIYEPRRGEASAFEFPADPSLPAAAESSPLRDPAAQVLRYIPLTRITFRVGDRVAADVAWIATHAPRLDAALAGIRRGVEARLAGEGAERAFCHLDATRTT